ncbi:MAG TPA: SDR family oxidoreductase [Steroidobacteraceae bacterium]|jgi:NAD(P)-dependent dehydrogenase (short-subunit alcohol dehydrogenase family)
MSRDDLNGRVAIVTGAGGRGGIGECTARALAEAGARVVLADLGESKLEETTAALLGQGHDVAHCATDISSERSVEALIRFAREKYGRIDILDNNAASQGQPEDRDLVSMPVELWDHIMGVNARGAMLMCKHVLPVMIDGGGGSIINISSGTSIAGDFFATAYAASKGAVNTLTRYVATQYGSQGIRCNALVLGLIATPVLERAMPEPIREIFQNAKLVGRLGDPKDVAEMVVFLASGRSSFITGQLLPVDGGFYAHTPTTVPMTQLLAQMMAKPPA